MSGDFLFQAFVYLTAAVIAVPIAARLGLGTVFGYLLAGVVIGPFGLGAAWRGRRRHHAPCRVWRGDDAFSRRTWSWSHRGCGGCVGRSWGWAGCRSW
jgi:hypothetical protein